MALGYVRRRKSGINLMAGKVITTSTDEEMKYDYTFLRLGTTNLPSHWDHYFKSVTLPGWGCCYSESERRRKKVKQVIHKYRLILNQQNI